MSMQQKKAKCMQSNDNHISAAQTRVIGKATLIEYGETNLS